MTSTVILSPHPDDAVLSLWHVLSGPGDVRVFNLFAAAPSENGELGSWDRETGAKDPVSRAAERREEDFEALGLARRRPEYFDFLDDQYREAAPPAAELAERVSAALGDATRVLVPAALGDHPDHRLAREGGLAIRDQGMEVVLYADIPHATRNGWPGWVTGSSSDRANVAADWEARMEGTGITLSELEPQIHALDAGEEARKREALGCYRTQLAALREGFPTLERPDALKYELTWSLPLTSRDRAG